MAAIARKIKQYGLTELYTTPGRPAQVDVVLVHGLNGHPKDTWTSKTGNVFWPTDILPEFLESSHSSVRILTYGYNANITSFTDGASKDRIHHHAETLASELYANRSLRGCLERPIVFVCHSLGGLVVKRCMIACRSQENDKLRHLRSIYISTFGILFLGTPHTGSDLAKWGLLLQKICSAVFPRKFLDTSPQLIETLKSNNEVLQNINRLFNDFFSRFHIYLFHETRPLDLKGTREFIVDEASAAPDIEGAERMGIEADHSTMVKFEDDSSPGFEAVAEAIIRYSREAPSLIIGRWREEKAHVQLQNRSRADELTRSNVDLADSQSEAEIRMGGSVPNLSLPPIFSDDHTSRMSQSVELLPPQRGPLFVVPPGFHPNDKFIGMEKELHELHIRLFNTKRREERAAAVLICGGPGSGKTHLARQYVHTHRKDFPGGIFWIDAKSFTLMSTCYWDVAQAAALTSADNNSQYPTSTDASVYVEQVRHWFESKEEWLIVFDGLNFDEDSQLNDFKKYLPFSKNTSIIYTSVDRTLAKKQRLFEPYRLTVRPLKVDDARQLLLDELDLKKPTPEQWKKSTEIVLYFQCLPLAIHAISHRLSATRKPLERYHIDSHLTDQRLAEPFIGIMQDLRTHKHIEAMNLINILSFFGHHIPVGMISWGKSALEGQEISILTSSRSGEPGDIDTTIGILIQYGLIERISDCYPTKSILPSLTDKDSKAESPESETSGSDSFSESMTASGIYQNAIDVIKIHSVVQVFFRDELKITDGKNKQLMSLSPDSNTLLPPQHQNPTNTSALPSFYLWWLLNATRVFCKSYENARYKMTKDFTGSVFVKDLHEYETHAERLMEHYQKVDSHLSVSMAKEAKQSLKDAVKDIKAEIRKISPNSSEVSLRQEKSIFDRSSSSSSGPASSLEDSGVSRSTTWYGGDWEIVKVQSPVEISFNQDQDQNPVEFPVANRYREMLEEKNDGYLSDSEGLENRTRRSSMSSSRYSQATEKAPVLSPAPTPELDGPASNDSGWETVQRKKKPSKPQKSRFRGGRFNRDLGTYRPSPVTKVSSAQGEGSMSRSKNARDMLESFQKSTIPKQPADRTVMPPTFPSAYQKENMSPNISLPTKDLNELPQFDTRQNVPRLLNRSVVSSPGVKPRSTVEKRLNLRTEFNVEGPSSGQGRSVSSHRENPLSRSDPSLVKVQPRRDVNSAPGSRNHSRNSTAPFPSASRESSRSPLPQAPVSNSARLAFTPRLSSNEFSSPPLTYTSVPDAGPFEFQNRNRRDQNFAGYPSPYVPTPLLPLQAVPGGYTSEPLSEPMSRDASGQSRASWQTDPNPLSRQISQPLPPPPSAYQAQLPVSPPTLALVYGPENNTRIPSTSINGAPAYVVPVTSPPPPVEFIEPPAPLTSRFGYGGEPETITTVPGGLGANQRIFFGEHEVDVDQARRRVIDWNRRQTPPALVVAGDYDPRTGLLLQAPRMEAQISDPGTTTTTVQVPVAVVNLNTRTRSGSFPTDPRYPGLGLGINPQQYPPSNNNQ